MSGSGVELPALALRGRGAPGSYKAGAYEALLAAGEQISRHFNWRDQRRDHLRPSTRPPSGATGEALAPDLLREHDGAAIEVEGGRPYFSACRPCAGRRAAAQTLYP